MNSALTNKVSHVVADPSGSSNSNATGSGNNNPHEQTTGTNVPSSNVNKLDEVLTQSKDAQTMISVLKDMGIDEFEPRVVNQLLEFSYS